MKYDMNDMIDIKKMRQKLWTRYQGWKREGNLIRIDTARCHYN